MKDKVEITASRAVPNLGPSNVNNASGVDGEAPKKKKRRGKPQGWKKDGILADHLGNSFVPKEKFFAKKSMASNIVNSSTLIP